MRGAVLLLVALSLAGCGAEAPAAGERAPSPAVAAAFRDPAHGLAVAVPAGWHRATTSLTPALVDPREVLTVATFPLRPAAPGGCAHVPEQALRDLGPADVLVTLEERHDAGRLFAAGPPALGPAETLPTDFAVCAGREGDVEEHWRTFSTGGRGFHLYAGLGRAVRTARRAQLDELLASLRIEPLVRRGRLAVLPPEGWTVVDEPLTGFDELAVASFPVPPGPADANCTPRRALDAMPADGAWLYVTVSDAPGEESLRPSGARVLERPERPYECMGVSRRASWTEHGVGVLANLYLGPEASQARRAELERAFDSLVIRE